MTDIRMKFYGLDTFEPAFRWEKSIDDFCRVLPEYIPEDGVIVKDHSCRDHIGKLPENVLTVCEGIFVVKLFTVYEKEGEPQECHRQMLTESFKVVEGGWWELLLETSHDSQLKVVGL